MFGLKIKPEGLNILQYSGVVQWYLPAGRQGTPLEAKVMDEYFVYAIESEVDSRIYVGISKNPNKRLLQHNRGDTKSTKPYRPWLVIYSKKIGSRLGARKEEKRLKSGYGKEFLKSLT